MPDVGEKTIRQLTRIFKLSTAPWRCQDAGHGTGKIFFVGREIKTISAQAEIAQTNLLSEKRLQKRLRGLRIAGSPLPLRFFLEPLHTKGDVRLSDKMIFW